MPNTKSLIVAVAVLAVWAVTIGLLVPGPFDEAVVALVTYFVIGKVM